MILRLTVLLPLFLAGGACSAPPRYPLSGQVLRVDAERAEITIKHDDIRGFMPAMTMPFKVRDVAAVRERKAGDLITATLVVKDSTGYLEDVVKIGEAPVPPDIPSAPARILELGAEVADVQFTDQAGQDRRLSDWRGKTLALTFVYTRCPVPNFCPLMDRHFAAVQGRIKAEQLQDRVRLLSVSFDPAFDTPQVLNAHASRVGADPPVWSYVTGEVDAIDPFAAAFGVSVIREDKPMQEIMHNLRTAVISADGRLAAILNGNDWAPEQLMAAIREAESKR